MRRSAEAQQLSLGVRARSRKAEALSGSHQMSFLRSLHGRPCRSADAVVEQVRAEIEADGTVGGHLDHRKKGYGTAAPRKGTVAAGRILPRHADGGRHARRHTGIER